ncbi:MAG: ABC transporter permease subunit [Treponema sp.]|jgi:ABC-2 type transport system permease protein|nr:ABC transporter permease subunit [Treponema sp.]
MKPVKRVWALTKKEVNSFLRSAFFYASVVFFLLFASVRLYYIQNFFLFDTASLRPFFSSFPLVYIFVIPAITMKSWAEEKKLGTIELLLTMPFSENELCIGKFLSSFLALFVMLVLSTAVPLSLIPLGSFDPGLIAAEYLGALMLGACGISVSLFFSSVSKNQAASFLGSSALLLCLTLPAFPGIGASMPYWLSVFFNLISLSSHFESFARGLLDTRDLLFFILGTILLLFLNTRVLIWRRRN